MLCEAIEKLYVADALLPDDEHPPAAFMPSAFMPTEFRIKWVTQDWEAREAHKLRRAVFCMEQGIFVGDDRDAIDDRAQLLVALTCVAGMPDQVVGTVRIHDESTAAQPDLWYGSRLAVHAAFRKHGRLGATLIRLAVTSAHALGCRTFLAHVQSQNAPLFRRLHWDTLAEETLLGRPHTLMQADLAHYPPCFDPKSGFVTQSSTRVAA
ncbi:MSMEG_0567/Sll0786 family nitrogen starvation N-acetyltransferase [Uliginosibacterium sp. H1]|uniref:MSMEG_0567/Sll0786 family nitrogen starvation N-acetyltransferase n=1 Tax=Uliginosibacterium sp. H1 TaxID=3114757 RepID=UPI002E1897E1|nr:MSMEG_0567/Sll0786 family nitrogen starvation N-acetyltransferase [Uliginosibacterium sp. H1]